MHYLQLDSLTKYLSRLALIQLSPPLHHNPTNPSSHPPLPRRKPPLLRPPPLKNLQPLTPLPRQLPPHSRLGHPLEP